MNQFEIGENELKNLPALPEDEIVCDICGEKHPIEYGQRQNEDGEWVDSKTLAFFKCGESSYLAGIEGRDIRRHGMKNNGKLFD